MKLSIIIPCYNASSWIEQCLLSALQQTYEDVEVIFVDNESTDNSVNIAQKIKDQHKELIISEAKNIYPNCWDEARSEGFTLMTGDYVLVMGADDFLDPEFASNCMSIIKKYPDKIKVLQSPIRGVRGITSEIINEVHHGYRNLKEFKELCLERCPVNTPTVIYNTDLYRSGLLTANPEIYGGAADYDLYCRLADNGIFIYSPPKWLGFYYRWHDKQATWSVQREGKNYDKIIQEYWRKKWHN
jgi:glycosyltransferase involved in cell wall biosynthesis